MLLTKYASLSRTVHVQRGSKAIVSQIASAGHLARSGRSGKCRPVNSKF